MTAMSQPQYVASAARPLADLHIPDGAVTRCGELMDADDLWMPVERRPGDRVCAGCEGRPEPAQAALL